jgi:hypothetical protein
MTDRIRVRRPWFGVLAPATAAVFSAAVVWASGHDPVPSVVTAAVVRPSPVTNPTPDAAAALNRQLAAQERELARLSAHVRALRSAVARATPPPTPSTGTTSSTRSGTWPVTPHVAPPTSATARATHPSARPTPSAAALPTQPPGPPPVPTPHLTTRSS